MDASLHAGSVVRRWREAGQTLVGRLSDFGRRARGLALMSALLWAAAWMVRQQDAM